MKCILPFIFTILLLVSCQTLPPINAALPSAKAACPEPFLKEPWRLIHAIESHMAGSTGGAIIGITVADPATRFVSCAIITAEGMVLLEAEAKPTLKIHRALPPFNSPNFAENMIDDIKLIYFAPEGAIQSRGTLSDGANICRWRGGGGDWTDVVARLPQVVEINRYSAQGFWKRRIKLSSTNKNIYQHVELTAKETFNYSLIMTLIEAEPVKGE